MANINWTEISPPETKRTYFFPDGKMIVVDSLCKIEVRESGKHRLECTNGRKLFVSPGWVALEIVADEWTF